MYSLLLFTQLAGLLAVTLAAPLDDLVPASTGPFLRHLSKRIEIPLPPSQDPFYTPDGSAWKDVLPGTILKQRDITPRGIGNLTTLANLQNAYQLLYRTTDVHGLPSYTVTTILKPPNANPLLHMSYQPATDSPNIDCAPSYGLQAGASPTAFGVQTELYGAMSPFLAGGVIVSVPDYEGPQAAFTVGPESAKGVLDSIRAVLKSGGLTGVSPNASTTLIGYSGGALASEWAAEFHSAYAPELNIIGAAIGGLPTNISKTISVVNGRSNVGLVAASFLGIAAKFPAFKEYIDKNLIKNRDLFDIPLSECMSSPANATYGYGVSLANENIASWFVDNATNLVRDNSELLNQIGVMGLHGTPSFPMYVWKSTTDEVVPTIEDTNALVEKYCSTGTKIEYVRYANSTHSATFVLGFPGAARFIGSLYAGISPQKCTVTDMPGAGASASASGSG
ncbi:putative lipase 8 precursor [Venturia nashicola]|uniref:Putative lipase 8 n=1 Tax=Venturia nashicola TaxID=86259 RepID=A0A4Z1NWS4_9PEZI|nr:putative lipase 8 precursor [Venturia nashicola]